VTNSRDKGRRGEIEAFKKLSGDLGFVITRNVDQAREGGADCINLPGFAPEIKRRKVLSRPAWWKQAVEQAAAAGTEPIVWYRQDRSQWRALIAATGGYRDVSYEESLDYVRDKLARLYGIYPAMKEAA
jgi:hypothetical protein